VHEIATEIHQVKIVQLLALLGVMAAVSHGMC